MTDEEQTHEEGDIAPYVTIGRLARVCPEKDCFWRSFGDADAKCPTHGRAIPQPDRPYRRYRKEAQDG